MAASDSLPAIFFRSSAFLAAVHARPAASSAADASRRNFARFGPSTLSRARDAAALASFARSAALSARSAIALEATIQSFAAAASRASTSAFTRSASCNRVSAWRQASRAAVTELASLPFFMRSWPASLSGIRNLLNCSPKGLKNLFIPGSSGSVLEMEFRLAAFSRLIAKEFLSLVLVDRGLEAGKEMQALYRLAARDLPGDGV